MAQLKDSIVSGSLRVTDTTYTNDLIISNTTAPTIATNDYLLLADASDSNKILKGPSLNTSNTTVWLNQAGGWSTPTPANISAAPAAGASTIITVGTVTTGTWNANIIGVAYGGTGAAKVNKNLFFAGSSTTDNTAPSWRKIAAADLPLATTSAVGGVSISSTGGLSVTNTGVLSVSYGTSANTALQGNQVLFKLNNADKTASSAASFYAPTAGGTAQHILVATGATSTPNWSANAYIIDESGSSVKNKRNELVLGNATGSGSNGSSFGRLALYSENTAGTYLISDNGTAWKTATLPAATGMLAMIQDSTAKGSDTKPVKVAATGLITECSTYAGGTKVTLNGTAKGASDITIYAPTSYGTSGYVLNAAGENNAPTWINKGNGRIFYGTCDTAAATGLKKVICTAHDKVLTNGDVLIVRFTVTNTCAVGSLQISIVYSDDDAAGTTAKNIKRIYNAAINNLNAKGELQANSVGVFVYDGTYWIMTNADYNNTYDGGEVLYSAAGANRTAETAANGGIGLHRYSLEMMTANLTWSSIASKDTTAIANTTDNNKVAATASFLLDSPIYYQSTNTHCAPGGAINVNGYTCVAMDLRYSCGTSSNTWSSLAVQKPVYLIGKMNTPSTFKIDATKWWGQELPNSNDGKIYIYLGMSYGANTIYLAPYHPIYWHDGTSLRVYSSGTTLNLNGTDYAGALASIYAPTSSGTSGYLLQSGGANTAPSWIQATDANTGSTIVKRDASGNFSAGTITASLSGDVTGNATTATTASYLSAPGEAGIISDQYGNFKHKRSTNTDFWQIQNSAGTTKFSVYPETGKVAVTGDIVTASGARVGGSGGALYLGNSDNSNWVLTQDICSHTGSGDTYWSARANGTGHFKSVYGAVWNDYAEMRNVPEAQLNINRICDEKGEIERDYPYAGRCVSEIGNGEMKLTNKRMQKGCKIISDTFGFCIGETENCKTPIAVTGRVLAYPLESLKECTKHIGDFVCSGPNGTVSIMTSLEAIRHPESIIGTISEIPTYEIWHCGNKITKPIQVNGRIWIYVR